jgi:SagB-type dehydrogenase family enzyme
VKAAPAILVVAAVYPRTTDKYGDRGRKYVHMDVGHAAQNVYLQAVALDLCTTFVGAFHDNQIKQVLELPAAEHPLGLMPVGHPR